MKNKEDKLYKMSLTSCLLMLFLCVILKILGFEYFNLNQDIKILKFLNDIIMNNIICSFIVSFILKFISGFLIFSIIIPKEKIHIFHIMCLTFFTILIKFTNSNIGIIVDAIILLIYPLAVMKINKVTILNTIYSLCLNTIYQLISIFIRNLGTVYVDTFITSLLMNMDYFILLIITLLYIRKGGVDLCLMVHSYSFQAKMLWKKLLKNSQLFLNREVENE